MKILVACEEKRCSKCWIIKNIDYFHKDKNKTVARCKECVKVYYSEYRNKDWIKEKIRDYNRKRQENPLIREKKNEYIRKRRKQPHIRIVKNNELRNWTEREKNKSVQYKGGKCYVCWYDKCVKAMDFHHTNPKEKDWYKHHRTFEKNRKELDKCILVCCRCHREIHAWIIKL